MSNYFEKDEGYISADEIDYKNVISSDSPNQSSEDFYFFDEDANEEETDDEERRRIEEEERRRMEEEEEEAEIKQRKDMLYYMNVILPQLEDY